MTTPTNKISDLDKIITQLRAPGGCPWDRKQTPQTLRKYILEEAHELIEAIDSSDSSHIQEELGDLLFQLLFIVNYFNEKDTFSLDDVIETISQKMIRRHPHVFGDSEIKCEKELRLNWAKIKQQEQKEKNTNRGLLTSIPKTLPALRRAQRVSERAAHQGFEWPSMQLVVDKLQEELQELQEAIYEEDEDAIFEEMGDMIFTLVNIGRLSQITAEETLHAATEKFINRFNIVEETVKKTKRDISEVPTNELINIWNDVKMI